MVALDMASSSSPAAHTFRGRSLEELLPQVRAALGPDAVVVRWREGLAGGVGGFFQRPYVEVEARRPEPPREDGRGTIWSEGDGELTRNDRATAEGLASPAIRALVEQASPFAEALARAGGPTSAATERATGRATERARAEGSSAAARERARRLLEDAAADAAPAGLYGPQPNVDAVRTATLPAPEVERGSEAESAQEDAREAELGPGPALKPEP